MASLSFRYALIIMVVLHLAQLGSCDYCTNSLALSSCPYLDTDDSVDLSSYSGKWYEIGSSANVKNVFEAGGVCAEAQYTVVNSTTIKVVNSNFITATPVQSVAVVAVSSSSSSICKQARIVCSEITTANSLLNEGLSTVSKFQSKISGDYPTEAASLSTAATNIKQAASGMGTHLDTLSTHVTTLQTQNSQLSQKDGDASAVVAMIKSTLDLADAEVTSLRTSSDSISSGQEDIIKVAKSLFEKGEDAIGLSLELTADAGEILGGAKIIEAQVVGMSAAISVSKKAVNEILSDDSKPLYNVSTIAGKAVVNGSAGKLSVTFDPLHGEKIFPAASYWILALHGSASSGYDAALVYSCQNVLTGGVDQSLYILSRTPSLAQDVIDGFLQLAASKGLYQACDAPFVYTVRSDKCPN